MEKQQISNKYIFNCIIGGMFACSLTQAVQIPFENIKYKKHLNLAFRQLALFDQVVNMSKRNQILTGLTPTFIGYSLYGMAKFGSYELFKIYYKNIVGEQFAIKHRILGWSISSVSADFIGWIFLCPWQNIRKKLMVNKLRNQQLSLKKVINQIHHREFYRMYLNYCFKTMAHTMVRFAGFQLFFQFFNSRILTKTNSNQWKYLGISFVSGFSAGFLNSILSLNVDFIDLHRYKNIKLENKRYNFFHMIKQIYKGINYDNYWKPFILRICRNGIFNGFQWLIYQSFKLHYKNEQNQQ